MSLNTHKFYRMLKHLNNEILALREQQITFKEDLNSVYSDVTDLDIRIGIFFEAKQEYYQDEIDDLEYSNSSLSQKYASSRAAASRAVNEYRDLYDRANDELSRTTEELDEWKEKYSYLEEDDNDDDY